MSAETRGFAWSHSPYKGATLLVHLALADVANDMHDYRLWASVAKIAEKARLGRSAVSAALSTMVADGFLEVLTEGGGRGNHTEYRFLMPETARIVGGSIGPKPRDSVGQTARSTAETARSVESSPISQPKEPKENPGKPLERRIVERVWERKSPKPATPFVGVVKIARKLLDAGWEPQQIEDAMVAVPTISVGWLEGKLNGRNGTNGRANAESNQEMIDRRFGFAKGPA